MPSLARLLGWSHHVARSSRRRARRIGGRARADCSVSRGAGHQDSDLARAYSLKLLMEQAAARTVEQVEDQGGVSTSSYNTGLKTEATNAMTASGYATGGAYAPIPGLSVPQMERHGPKPLTSRHRALRERRRCTPASRSSARLHRCSRRACGQMRTRRATSRLPALPKYGSNEDAALNRPRSAGRRRDRGGDRRPGAGHDDLWHFYGRPVVRSKRPEWNTRSAKLPATRPSARA